MLDLILASALSFIGGIAATLGTLIRLSMKTTKS